MYQPYASAAPSHPWARIVLAAALGIVSILVVLLVLDILGYYGTPPGGRLASGVWFYGFFPLFLLFWLVLIAVRMAFWSGFGGRWAAGGGPYPDRAIRVARHRYARGEITREQYEQLMADLSRHGPAR